MISVLLAKLLAFELLHFVLQGNLPVTPGISTSYFCISVPCDEKDIFFFFFLVLSSRRSCRSS